MWEALATAGDDFFELGRYLVVGSLLAAMQTLVSQPLLLELGSGGITSIKSLVEVSEVLRTILAK